MTRHYARPKTNERAVDSAPVNTPRGTTILSSICLDGKTAHTVYQGGTTAECFAEYLENIFLPTLSGNAIIIMDNMRSHHAKVVKDQGISEKSKSPYCVRITGRNRKGIFNCPSKIASMWRTGRMPIWLTAGMTKVQGGRSGRSG